MKKVLSWAFAAALFCGLSLFTSCNNDDNPVDDPSTKKVDLATLTADYTAQDGDILTGKLANPVQITVADGARITIDGAYINDEWFIYNEKDFAGITCLGDATITISDSNSISGFHTFYPAIFVPEGHTLTFQGNGILSARGNGPNGYYNCLSPAIGSVRAGADCGNLVFLGGKIYAEAGNMCAAIGAGYTSNCGDITIGGTANVTAKKGSSAMHAIGFSYNEGEEIQKTCGTITIGGTQYYNGSSKTWVSEDLENALKVATFTYPAP